MKLFETMQTVWFGQPVGVERPIGLLLALVVLVAAAAVTLRALRRGVPVKGWVTPGREAQLVAARWRQRRALRLALGGLGLAFLSAAWAGPTLGAHEQKVTRRGIDLVLALDASRSMLAEDVAPNRLTAARVAAEQLLDQLKGDRVGIVAFAADAFVQAPLTTDTSAVRLYLRAVDPLQMQQGGTAIAGALQQAAGMLQRAEADAHDRAVLLISDGEDWEGGAEEQARAMAAKGIHLFTLGVGTQLGAPVPVVDRRGRLTGYEKDEAGTPVMTRPNPAALAALAEAGNGEAFFNDGFVDVNALARRIDGLQKGELGASTRVVGIERYQWFALPGLLLLALALGLGETRKLPRVPGAAAGAAAALALLLAAPAQAAGWLESPNPGVKAGLSAYEQGDYAAAAQAFSEAKVSPEAAPVAAFNRGVALLKAGEKEQALSALEQAKAPALQGRDAYNAGLALAGLEKREEAIGAFRNALVADPSNDDARHNLEVLLEQQQQEQQQNQDQQKDQQQQGQDKQDQQQQGQDQKDQQQPGQEKKDQQQQGQDQKDQQQPGQDQKDQQQQGQDQKDQQQPGQDQKDQQQPSQPRGEQEQPRPTQAGAERARPLSDAERTLDQLKQGERLLPVGRPTTPPPPENRHEHTW